MLNLKNPINILLILILIGVAVFVGVYFYGEYKESKDLKATTTPEAIVEEVDIEKDPMTNEEILEALREGKLPLIMITDDKGETTRYPSNKIFINQITQLYTLIDKLKEDNNLK